MKKSILIIGSILAAAIAAAILFYYSRKDRSMQQYVHAQSISILAIAVDDLLIDHIDQFFKTSKSDSSQRDQNKLFKALWNAGVHIPAHVFFFNLPDDPAAFYSIQKITDEQKWQQFVQQYAQQDSAANGASLADSLLHIGKHVAIYQMDKQLVIRLGSGAENTADFSQHFAAPAQWLKVSETEAFTKDKLQHHLAYWHSNGRLALYADIDDQQARLSGEWILDSLPANKPLVRHLTQDNTALRFWTSGSLNELPILNDLLTKITASDTLLPASSLHYVDLLVRNKMVVQTDTIITYDYDEDFNTVEQQTIAEQEVPLIESVWQVDSAVAQQLPRKMFYNFYLSQTDSLAWLSTQQVDSFSAHFDETTALAGLQLNFKNWPSNWSVGPFTWLQANAVTATLHATYEGTKKLRLEGAVNYPKLTF